MFEDRYEEMEDDMTVADGDNSHARRAPWGNQHQSRRAELMRLLRSARRALRMGAPFMARMFLNDYRRAYALVPDSTRRRWRCGR